MGASSSLDLSEDEIDEITRTTNFTRAEIRQMHQKFLTDFPNGEITQDGFHQMYSCLFPDGDTTRFAGHVFRAYDMDGNGVIDFKEFMTTISIASKGTLEDKLNWAFKLYDIDGDNSVSRSEAVEMIMAIYRMQNVPKAKEKAEDAALRFFVFADKNKNNSLSKEEFVNAIQNSAEAREILQGSI